MNWTNEVLWSYAETLVFVFNVSSSFQNSSNATTVGSSSNNNGVGTGSGDETSILPHLTKTSQSNTNIQASRNGYLRITFTASMGIASVASAGVQWSLSFTYSDLITFSANAGGGATYVKTPVVLTNGNGSGNSTQLPSTSTGSKNVPDDFTAENSWTASLAGYVQSSSTLTVVSTSFINPDNEVERDLAGNSTLALDHDITFLVGWSSSSQSGSLSLTSFPVTPGSHPLANCDVAGIADEGNLADSYTAPSDLADSIRDRIDDVNSSNEGGSTTNWNDVFDLTQPPGEKLKPVDGPIGKVEGKGSASMSAGSGAVKTLGRLSGMRSSTQSFAVDSWHR